LYQKTYTSVFDRSSQAGCRSASDASDSARDEGGFAALLLRQCELKSLSLPVCHVK
jgi:hypothetical protein